MRLATNFEIIRQTGIAMIAEIRIVTRIVIKFIVVKFVICDIAKAAPVRVF